MRWKTSIVLFVMILTASFALAAPASAAPETAAECEGGANGFVDIPDNLTGEIVRGPIRIGPIVVELHKGYVQGLRGWARVRDSTAAGDMVWMDWTTNGGASWTQCGPFFVQHAGQVKTSAAQRTSSSPSWKFRACGYVTTTTAVRCTDWW